MAERLKELARRQQQEAERMRRQQQMQQGGGGGASSESQRQLAEEAEQMARQLERLSRERQYQQMADAARRWRATTQSTRVRGCLRPFPQPRPVRPLLLETCQLPRRKVCRRRLNRQPARFGRHRRPWSEIEVVRVG
jgi:hypothetical protein